MIRVDLNRLLPSNAVIYLLTFMPGVSFLLAVMIGNPNISTRLIERLQITIPSDRYRAILPALFLFLAFVGGAVFVTLVSLIQYLPVRYACRLWYFLKPLFWRALLPLLRRLMTVPPTPPGLPPPKPKPRWLMNWLLRLNRRAQDTAFPRNAAEEPAFLWWEAIAKQLLRRRYGMEENALPAASLEPLRAVLTEPTLREKSGYEMLIALHATGWSLLAATYFAPELRTRWFHVTAFLLIAIGLLHDFTTLRLLADPARGDTLRLRAVLREFPKLKPQSPAENHPEGSDEEH